MNSALLIIERKEQILSLLYQDNRLTQVKVHEKGTDTLLRLGSVYIGKVKNVVPAIDAAFVEVSRGMMGFLPLKNTQNAVITNRNYDGRILAGDEILIQIEKEAIKTKDPGLTCNLSFTGKYCVLTTGNKKTGYSSKLDPATRSYWKNKLNEWKMEDTLQKENTGIVIRTNVLELMKASEGNLPFDNIFLEEFTRLLQQKNKILKEVSYRTCYSCLFQPLEGYLTDIRDTYESSFDKIITDNSDIYERIREAFPFSDKITLYEDPQISLEKLYSTETRLKEALEEKVWLKSGGFLIIQQTEALTVIDVNSGKIQKKHPGDTLYFEINKEAAREIALQLKLRNLSGIIIVDFISQSNREEDEKLLQYLSSLVKQDPIKTNVIDMTPLGLVEITRKKINKSLKEQLGFF